MKTKEIKSSVKVSDMEEKVPEESDTVKIRKEAIEKVGEEADEKSGEEVDRKVDLIIPISMRTRRVEKSFGIFWRDEAWICQALN